MLLTMREGAQLLGLSVRTVEDWRRRGLLVPVGRGTGKGRPFLYDSLDFLTVERQTRRGDPTKRRARRLA